MEKKRIGVLTKDRSGQKERQGDDINLLGLQGEIMIEYLQGRETTNGQYTAEEFVR